MAPDLRLAARRVPAGTPTWHLATPPHSPLEPQALALTFILALGAGGGVIDGDLWWASTNVTTVVGSGVIGKYFTANHYDYTYLYTWNYITENGTNLNGIICPDGWRLPTTNEQVALTKLSGFTSTTFQDTYAGWATNIDGSGKNGKWFGPGVATGGSDASKYPYTTDTHLFFSFSGYGPNQVNNTLSSNQVGTFGYYCSSTVYNFSAVYCLAVWYRYLQPQYGTPQTYGIGVRCVADAL